MHYKFTVAGCLPVILVVSLITGNAFGFSPVLNENNLDYSNSLAVPGNIPAVKGVLRINDIRYSTWNTEKVNYKTNADYLISFTNSVSVGSLLVYGDWQVSYLKTGRNPDIYNTNLWQTISFAGNSSRLLRIIPFPENVKTTSIRLNAPATPDNAGLYGASLLLAVPLKERVRNIAPDAHIQVSSSAPIPSGFRPSPRQNRPSALLDGIIESRNWRSGNRSNPITEKSPEWIMLDWGKPRRISGCILFAGAGSMAGKLQIQRYIGHGYPDAANDNAWETITTLTGKRPWEPRIWELWADFNGEIKTRALRFLATRGLGVSQTTVPARNIGASPNAISFGEIMVLQKLTGKLPQNKQIKDAKSELSSGVIPIKFTAPEDGLITIRILDENNNVIKNLINGESFTKGNHTVWWDLSNINDYWQTYSPGRNSTFTPSPELPKLAVPGKYHWEGIFHPPLQLSYLYSYYPLKKYGMPWKTVDKSGGWLADHDPPRTIIRCGTNMWIGAYNEAGDGIIQCDKNMRKLWGEGRIWLACPRVYAADGDNVYFVEQGGWTKNLLLMVQVNNKTRKSRRVFVKTIPENSNMNISGLAVVSNIVYLADRNANHIQVIDISANLAAKPVTWSWVNVYKSSNSEQLHIVKEIPLPKPGRIRPYDNKSVIAISDKKVVRIMHNTMQITPIISGLTNPMGLACDTNGLIYVGEMAPVHQVKVFTPAGKVIRVIGKPRKHKLGLFDKNNLESPMGLAIGPAGNLWVAEHNKNLKRVSVWDKNGNCINQVLGPPIYGGGGDIDPRNPNRLFYHGKEFIRNPDTDTINLVAINWRTDEHVLFADKQSPDNAAPAFPFYNNNKLYFAQAQHAHRAFMNTIYFYDNGILHPVAAMGTTPDIIRKKLGVAVDPVFNYAHSIEKTIDKRPYIDWFKNPRPEMGSTRCGVRWTGQLVITNSGEYTFFLQGWTWPKGHLYIDGVPVVEKNNKHWEASGTIKLSAGRHDIIIEAEAFNGNIGRFAAAWNAPGIKKTIIPESSLYTSQKADAPHGLSAEYFAAGRDKYLFTWTDLNDDWTIQTNEVNASTPLFNKRMPEYITGNWQFRINTNFEAAARTQRIDDKVGMVFFKVKSRTAKDYPIYKTPEKILPFPYNTSSAIMVDGDGNAITLSPYLTSFRPDGHINWRYINRWPGLHAGHDTQARGDEPGMLIATTHFLGSAVLNRDIGEIFCIEGNLGATYLFTTTGLYIDRVFEDIRRGLAWQMNSPPSDDIMKHISLDDEHFGGSFQKVQDKNGKTHYRYVVGKNFCAVVELKGLNKLQKIPGGNIEVTPRELDKARKLRQQRIKANMESKIYKIKKTDSIKIDAQTNDWSGIKIIDGFSLTYDRTNLYVIYRGTDRNATFQNAATPENYPEAFKHGDVLDIKLQTSPHVSDTRTDAGIGDIRISFVSLAGNPQAILYDYVVPGTPQSKKIPFSSPWRTIYVDRVKILNNADIAIKRKGVNYILEAAIPLRDIHLNPRKTPIIHGDVGKVLSDKSGTRAVERIYWSNKNTNIISDVPSEAGLQPGLWGIFKFEQ